MLKQNTLAEATTELGFATETNTPLTRKITVDGQECIIEGITADKMKDEYVSVEHIMISIFDLKLQENNIEIMI